MAWFSCCLGQRAASSVERTVGIDEVYTVPNLNLYTYEELLKATENFREQNEIGRGGFGSVYKGTLDDGSVAAIKVLAVESRQGSQEFLTEIKSIANVNHENIVKLYGCCAEGDHRIVVYGYLENNSLSKTLLGGRKSDIQFSWQTRRKICIGVARGLTYLHEVLQPHIIHRDIKASNILLDKDLSPKISDFGLAKFIAHNLTHVSTRVAGTNGYLAPEYALRGKVTRKADIYSFGVLVLEIVSGRCNNNSSLPSKEQYLLEWVWELNEGDQLVKAIDTSLNEDLNVEEACTFMKIGLLCTQGKPMLRPSISKVVKMLTGEMGVVDKKMHKPIMISEFMDQRESADGNSCSLLPSGIDLNSPCSAEKITTSVATMTFSSIYDRSN